jgi:hypothetical protein
LHAQLDSLQTTLENLSDNNIIDFYMIQNQLKVRFSIDKLKSYEWNPAEYNVCGAFAEILNGKYDSLEVRLHSFNMKMDAIPAYYEAESKYKKPTLEHCSWDLSFRWLSVFLKDLTTALNKSKLN